MNFWCGNPLDTQSLSTLHMNNGNAFEISQLLHNNPVKVKAEGGKSFVKADVM